MTEIGGDSLDVTVTEPAHRVVVSAPTITHITAPPSTRVSASSPEVMVFGHSGAGAVGPAGPPGPAGPEGPQGDPGDPAAGGFVYTQTTPSTVWDVTHGLGFNPGGIRVVGSDGNTYWPVVTHLDANTTRLNLPESINGTAYIS